MPASRRILRLRPGTGLGEAAMALIENRPGGWCRRLIVAAAGRRAAADLVLRPGGVPTATAFSNAPVEQLNVPSPSMGRDIRVEFLDGGRRARAVPARQHGGRDDFNGWDINTAAFDWYKGSGISVVMPVGGKSSFYSDWYGPAAGNGGTYTYKWETFLTQELPAYLAANKNVPQTGNAVVGLSMGGGVGADRWPPATRSSSSSPAHCRGSSTLAGPVAELIGIAMSGRRRLQPRRHVGAARDPAWAAQRPDGQPQPTGGQRHRDSGSTAATAHRRIPTLARTSARTFSAQFLENIAIDTNKDFRERYIAAGGHNAMFNFPAGIHSWGYWGAAAAADEAGHPAGARRQAHGCDHDNRSRSSRLSTLP